MKNIGNTQKNGAPCASRYLRKAELAVVACAALLIGVSIFSMDALAGLQREKHLHAVEALEVDEICVELIRLVSDAELDRNHQRLETGWTSIKRKLLETVGNMRAVSDDKQRLIGAERAVHAFIQSFERWMSMPHGDTARRKERDALKASLDERAVMLCGLLWDYESALHKKAHEADEAYKSKFVTLSWLATAVFFLVAWLVFRGVGESRAIDRSLCPDSGDGR